MAVVIETTLGDLTVDLFIEERPRACLNFLKLCKVKYYNFNLFHTVQHDFLAQTGDPTGSRTGGESIWGVLEGTHKRYFEAEEQPKLKHTNVGTVSLVNTGNNMLGSQFFITLASELVSLDNKHCIIGEVTEGHDVLRKLNETICDSEHVPYQDIRITHTVILDDPFPDLPGFREPSKSPEPTTERLQGGRIGADEEIDETVGKTAEELAEMAAERESKARATILEMVGDLPDAEMAPPENVLFVCKLNPVTNDNDLEIIFSRFGKIKSCEVIRDRQTGESLQYAFVEFADRKSCEDAYFKMDNVLIDDRRIHVDFSQSVAKIKWHGKGRGVTHYDDADNDKANKDNGKSKREEDRQKTKKHRSDRSSDVDVGKRYNHRSNHESYRDKKFEKYDRSYNYRSRENNQNYKYEYDSRRRDVRGSRDSHDDYRKHTRYNSVSNRRDYREYSDRKKRNRSSSRNRKETDDSKSKRNKSKKKKQKRRETSDSSSSSSD